MKTGSISIDIALKRSWKDDRIKIDWKEGESSRGLMPNEILPYIWVPSFDHGMKHKMSNEEVLSFKIYKTDQKLDQHLDGIFTDTCEFNYQDFPFDMQKCSFEFVIIQNGNNDVNITANLENTKVKNFEKEYNFTTGFLVENTGKALNIITLQLFLKRIPAHYMWVYYLPLSLVTIITGFSFIIPPSSIPGRMSLLVTLFLVQVDLVTDSNVSF